MEKINNDTISRINDFILETEDFKEDPIESVSDPFWQSLRSTGTEIWLDTGDIDEIKNEISDFFGGCFSHFCRI